MGQASGVVLISNLKNLGSDKDCNLGNIDMFLRNITGVENEC